MSTPARTQSWRDTTGFQPDVENTANSRQRRPYLKNLYDLVLTGLREALAEQLAGTLNPEITVLWTPVHGLCADLGIAHAKLNRLLKEFCGLTAQQLVDRERCLASNLDRSLTEEVVSFIRARFVPGANPKTGDDLDLHAQQLEFWRALREHRVSTPGWDNTAWARQHGFSSYTRFHRAFTLAYGKSPLQQEAETMFDAALYFRAAHSLNIRSVFQANNRFRAAHGMVSSSSSFPKDDFDHYSQLRSDNPDWWNRQFARYGLNKELHDLANQVNESEARFNPARLDTKSNTVCTRETKIRATNPLPPTPQNNPWPVIKRDDPSLK